MLFDIGNYTAGTIPALCLIYEGFIKHSWLVKRTPHRPSGEMINFLMQEIVAFKTDRITIAFFFEKLINIRVVKQRIAKEIALK